MQEASMCPGNLPALEASSGEEKRREVMIPFVKEGDICPVCKRVKLIAKGGVVTCPHCKRAAPDASKIASKVDELSKENEKLKSDNEKLVNRVGELEKKLKKKSK
jgi:uncharacterized Zn finger protein (UPF0148 family)